MNKSVLVIAATLTAALYTAAFAGTVTEEEKKSTARMTIGSTAAKTDSAVTCSHFA
jgi:hypothetical protein